MSCEKIVRRSFHMTSRCTPPRLPHRFSPGSKLFFGTVVGWLTCWVRSYDSCDMEHAALGNVFRASRSSNASSGLPGPPAGGRGEDGRIHNDSSRLSTAAERKVASPCLYTDIITFLYISSLCWRALCRCAMSCRRFRIRLWTVFEDSVAVWRGVGMAIWQGAAPKSAQTRDRAPTGNRENDGIVVSSRARDRCRSHK